ncbi:MAG: hypothetical protein AAF772_12330 [Acidobacteriota bacterium]
MANKPKSQPHDVPNDLMNLEQQSSGPQGGTGTGQAGTNSGPPPCPDVTAEVPSSTVPGGPPQHNKRMTIEDYRIA